MTPPPPLAANALAATVATSASQSQSIATAVAAAVTSLANLAAAANPPAALPAPDAAAVVKPPPPSTTAGASPPPLHLSGASTNPNASLLKLRGTLNGVEAVFLLDSGASSEFIDPQFAQRCGLKLVTSDRTVKLADGSIASAAGQAEVGWTLEARDGASIPFTSTFTATPLGAFDAIIGMSWLNEHDPEIGFRDRSIQIRPKRGGKPHVVKPMENLGRSAKKTQQLATITMRGLKRAMRHGDVEELYAIYVRPEQLKPTPSAAADAPKEVHVDDPLIRSTIAEFSDVLQSRMPNVLPPKRGVEHRIELKPGSRPPPARPLRPQSSKDLGVFDAYIKEGIASGIIRPSQSPYGSMALIVKKKDGTPRVVVDYRALNEITVKNKYPLPLMDDLFERVHGAKYFSKLDLMNGFHQILVAEEDIEKTAFRTRYGSYEYLVLPMGLCNAPGTFMQLMNDTFRDLLDKCVLVFLDDILIFSRTKEEHVQHIREVLSRLRAQKLYAKPSKCEFMRTEVEFLGHQLGVNGLAVSQDKIAAVRDWPTPKGVPDVRSFLGLAGFYRRFVKDFSGIALPLTELTKNDTPFAWGAPQQRAFDTLKSALCTAPVLLIPDPKLPFTLNCDACDYAVGAALQQDHGNGLQPVAYRSRKLTPAERNYDTREKEFLALVDACSVWRHHLHGHPFKLLTDHDSLKYHKTMPNLSPRLARWIEKMAEFEYDIEHIAGVKNCVADAISRRADLKPEVVTAALNAAVLRPRRRRRQGQAPVDVPPSDAIYHPRVLQELARRGVALRPEHAALVPHAAAAAAAAEVARTAAKEAAECVRVPAPDRPAPNKAGAIVMPSQRCTASSRRGGQCRARTAKGQYCWNHLQSLCGLRIKKSNVPGAGFGLFAARDLPAGHAVEYTGDRILLASSDTGGAYFLQLTDRTAIDAARTNAGEGRWVNDPRGTPLRANSEFRLHTPPGAARRGVVRMTRPIAAGEEILVRYGAAYWRYQAAGAPAQAKRQQPRARGTGARIRIAGGGAPPAAAAAAAHANVLELANVTADTDAATTTTTTATVTSELTGALRAAAKADVAYAHRVAFPSLTEQVRNGLLFEGDRLVVPADTALRTRLLAECHDAVTGAHFGRDKTLSALQSRFQWKGMAKDVEEYVATCDSCQRNKPSRQLTPGLLMPNPLPAEPCLSWTTDAVTGLPMTKRGHDSIQVYVERLLKLKRFAAGRKTDGAVEAAVGFLHNVVRLHGVPESVISDRDPRFTAGFYAELSRLLGVTLSMSTARHPQTDGQSEREIQTMITALRAFCNDHQDDWDDYLDMLELGFNSTVQASTGKTPHEMLYGMKPRLPVDVALAPLAPSKNPAAADRALNIQKAVEAARDHLLTAQERQARNANRHRRDAAFAVGDSVLLSTEGLQLRAGTNKLCSRYVGPFKVTAVVNRNAYTLELPSSMGALHPTFNIEKLKPYRDGRARFPTRPMQYDRPPPDIPADSNGDAQYVVERILAKRVRNRRLEFLVAWKGYAPEESTWEPRSNLDGALEAIAEFEANQAVPPAA